VVCKYTKIKTNVDYSYFHTATECTLCNKLISAYTVRLVYIMLYHYQHVNHTE